jgi:hypothetical protein
MFNLYWVSSLTACKPKIDGVWITGYSVIALKEEMRDNFPSGYNIRKCAFHPLMWEKWL